MKKPKQKKRFDELNPYKIIHHDWHSRYPIHVELDPTSRCNQDCLRCSYKQDIDGEREYIIQHQNIEIPFERLKELVREFSIIGIKAITISGGGDPLIYPRIDDIIRQIMAARIKFGIITNLAVTKDMEALTKAVWIRVSFDAASSDTYNKLHRPANKQAFDLVHKNIRSLVALNPALDIGINYLIQPENYHEIYETGQLVKELGVRYIRYVPVIATDPIDYDSLLAVAQPFLEQSKTLVDDNFHVFINRERFTSLADQRKKYNFCYKQQIHPLIGADGIIYPCCLLKYYQKHALGSIMDNSFKEVWDGEIRKKWLASLNIDHCPPCWFDKTNEFMEYLFTKSPKHVEFV